MLISSKKTKKIKKFTYLTERNKEEPLTICSEYKENVIKCGILELA